MDMHVVEHFDKARVGIQELGFVPNTAQDYLVVTARNLDDMRSIKEIEPGTAFVHPLSFADEANETLNSIAKWVRDTGAMDQRKEFGEDRGSYNLSFYRMTDERQTYPSLVNDFLLKDYIFPDRHPSDARCFDDLMRMLDRDRLAEAMRQTLVDGFEMPVREDAPLFFRRDLRLCSHPDHKHAAPAVHL